MLTLGTTADAKLVTNSATSPLPIIQTAAPIAGFFWVGALLLAGIFFYLHLYLQRLWEALADLPAVFPDGVSLDRKVDPWLVIGLVRRYVPRLAAERPTFWRLHTAVVVLSAWWAVPVTLLVFWGRYLRRHEWWGTGLHVLLLAAVIVGAFFFHGVAEATLTRSGRSAALRTPWRWGVAMVLVAVSVGVVSLGSIEGAPSRLVHSGYKRAWVPYLMERLLGYSVFANLNGADVSEKPSVWSDKKEQIELVRGALLRDVDLRGARAVGAFLVNADLSGARLERADLSGARLERADLTLAQLEGADLGGARLEGANLLVARLDGANLSGARLEGANLRMARLRGAKLNGAQLQRANLISAQLEGADLGELTPAGPERVDLSRT